MQRLFVVPLCLLFSAVSYCRVPTPNSRVAKAKESRESILWKPVHLQSQRFDDEVSPFGRIEMECDSFPQNEGATRVRWQFQAQSEPEARKGFALLHADMLLKHEGWLRLITSDYQQYLKAYKAFPDLGVASREAFIYRPKDEVTFKKMLGGIEMLGSRSVGRRSALVPQLFLLMTLDKFSFEKGAATFMVKFRPLIYGSSLDQSVGGGVDIGEVGVFSYSSASLLDSLVALFKEHRPRLAPGLDTSASRTSGAGAPREGATAMSPRPLEKAPAAELPMAEVRRQQRMVFEANRKAVKVLALPNGVSAEAEVAPVCVEVQRPDARTIQFPSTMEQMEGLPRLTLPAKALSTIRIQAHHQIAYKQAKPHLVFLGQGNPQGRRLITTPDQLPMTANGMGLDCSNLSLCLSDGDSGIWLLFNTVGTFAPGVYALTFPPISGMDARAELPTRDYYLFRVESPAGK